MPMWTTARCQTGRTVRSHPILLALSDPPRRWLGRAGFVQLPRRREPSGCRPPLYGVLCTTPPMVLDDLLSAKGPGSTNLGERGMGDWECELGSARA